VSVKANAEVRGLALTAHYTTIPKGLLLKYCIFSIERCQRLFQAWHGGPSVSLNKLSLFGPAIF